MPIRFACEHCESTLSVSSRKAGHQVMCPKCRQQTPVPQASLEPAAVASAEKPSPAVEKPAPRVESPPPRAEPKPQRDEPISPRNEPAPSPSTIISPPPSVPETKSVEEAKPTPEPVIFTSPTSPAPEAPVAVPEPEPYPPEDDDGPDEVTWVFEAPRICAATKYVEGDVDFNRISLPRYVVYGQGILLIALAMISLTLGILIGRGTAPKVAEKSGVAKPCFLTGSVTYQTSGGSVSPDAGAVLIVVPQDRRPDDKAPVEGLRPQDPAPSPDQPAIARIKSIGGDYVRADEQGNFKRVPDTGDYFLLVISSHAKRKPSERHESVHLAQIGRYFIPAPDLVDTQQYRWRSETIKRDKEYKFAFE